MSVNLRLFGRIILRNREAYILKTIALSVALATSIIITLFSIHEFGYDRFHENPDQIFRVLQKNSDPQYSGNRLSAKISSTLVDHLLSNQYKEPGVISRVKIMKDITIVSGEKTFHSQTIHAANSTISSVFSFQIIDGDINQFRNSHEVTAIISTSMAERFWGSSFAVGKHVQLTTSGDTLDVRIAAVFKDFPGNSHERFDLFISFLPSAIQELNFDPTETGVYGRWISKISAGKRLPGQSNFECIFQALPEIYFGPRALGENARHGDRYSIIILICITSLIFFLALTTFVNLTTLILPYRAKELAVKKLAGITRWRLIWSFLKESSSFIGLALALAFVLLTGANQVITSTLDIPITALIQNFNINLILVVLLLCSILIVSPVLMTVRFIEASPNRLLSTDTITFPTLKRYITFVQLVISIFLIIASVVVARQINYSLVKEPGQNHDQIVYVNAPAGITNEGISALRNGWRKYNPNILDVMAVSQLPDRVSSKEPGSPFYRLDVDAGFRDFFNLQMQEGFWFGPNTGDSLIVINREAKSQMADEAVPVLGVVDDINGLFNLPVKPVKIRRGHDFNYNWLCIRVLEVDIRRTSGLLSEQLSSDGKIAHVNYLDANFGKWINYQDRLNQLSGILTLIAGILSCCAIYGLSITIVRDKVKHIAVHRLLGASTTNVTLILAKDFAQQLIVALVIALPLSFLVLGELLRTFVHATKLSWIDAVYPLVYCILVILGICFFQAWSLQKTNFVEALKS